MDLQNPYLLIIPAAAVLLLLIVALIVFLRRRGRSLSAIIRRHAWAQASDVVIPDGMDGHVHVDQVLMTTRGLLALEIKTLRGAVFGAEKMEEWVMLDNGRRHGFRNPLVGLDERVTALRNFAEGVDVEGYVVIAGRVEFPKGRPARTLLPEDLAEKFEPVEGAMPENWRSIWGRVTEHARKV